MFAENLEVGRRIVQAFNDGHVTSEEARDHGDRVVRFEKFGERARALEAAGLAE